MPPLGAAAARLCPAGRAGSQRDLHPQPGAHRALSLQHGPGSWSWGASRPIARRAVPSPRAAAAPHPGIITPSRHHHPFPASPPHPGITPSPPSIITPSQHHHPIPSQHHPIPSRQQPVPTCFTGTSSGSRSSLGRSAQTERKHFQAGLSGRRTAPRPGLPAARAHRRARPARGPPPPWAAPRPRGRAGGNFPPARGPHKGPSPAAGGPAQPARCLRAGPRPARSARSPRSLGGGSGRRGGEGRAGRRSGAERSAGGGARPAHGAPCRGERAAQRRHERRARGVQQLRG